MKKRLQITTEILVDIDDDCEKSVSEIKKCLIEEFKSGIYGYWDGDCSFEGYRNVKAKWI